MAKHKQEKYWWNAKSSILKIKGVSVFRYALYLLFFLLTNHSALLGQSQNLVPNPGFEAYNTCEYFIFTPGVGYPVNIVYSPGYDSFPTALYWVATMPYNSPDYYNPCDTTTPFGHGVPQNINGYQEPHSGYAYTGICMYMHEYGTWDDYREYVEAKLLHPLSAGHQYYISFFVSLAVSHCPGLFGNVLSVDKIGAYLSDTFAHDTATFEDAYLPYTPSIESAPGWYIADSGTWTKISGVYTAQGGEQWITIGHFKDNEPQTDTFLYTIADSLYSSLYSYLYDSFFYCYMYVDDVCVTDIAGNAHDTAYCVPSFPASLTGLNEQGSYLWNTGDTTASIRAIAPGTYWRTLRGECLYYTDTITVTLQPSASQGVDTIVCNETAATIGIEQPGVSFKWSTGDTVCCITVSNTGLYSLTASDDCGTDTNNFNVTFTYCENCLSMPSAFTPNHDGLNDVFKPLAHCPISQFHMSIYNRWGQLVYASGDINESWDGAFNNTRQDLGDYFYYIKYTPDLPGENKEIMLKGDVTLIR